MTEVVLAERTVSGSYTATVRVDFANLKAGETAGISAYGWRTQAVGLSVASGKIFSWRRDRGVENEVSSAGLPKDARAALLRIDVEDGEIFRFSFSTDDGRTWQFVGDKIATASVEGARIALVYNGQSVMPGARFDWLRVEQK
jgi:hypothetical protein